MINVSVVGVGYWGPNLIRNFVANSGTNIEICCDLNEERLSSIRRTYPSLKTTTDFKKIIHDPKVDLIARSGMRILAKIKTSDF